MDDAFRVAVRRNISAMLRQGWNPSCTDAPNDFDSAKAEEVVELIVHAKPTCIVTKASGETREAYYFVVYNDCQFCVVAHIHPESSMVGGWTAGHAFITGWMNWHTDTPWDAVDKIRKQKDFGTVPSQASQYPSQ